MGLHHPPLISQLPVELHFSCVSCSFPPGEPSLFPCWGNGPGVCPRAGTEHNWLLVKGPKGSWCQTAARESQDPAGTSGCVWPGLLCREAVPEGFCLVRKGVPRTSLHCEPWEKTVHICLGNGLPNGSLLQMQSVLCALCALCRALITPGMCGPQANEM